jgi:hypothetical protein
VNRVMNVGFFKSGEIFCQVQKSKWLRQLFYYRLTNNADHRRYCYFLYNQEVMKDRIYVNQGILK